MRRSCRAAGLALLILGSLAAASVIAPGKPGPYTGAVVGGRLYTQPDPRAGGGIRGHFVAPDSTVRGVFAMPQHDWRLVYIAQLSLDGSFLFEGLPIARYDLLVVFEDALYEGVRLHRDENTLTAADLENIQQRMNRSNPFFNENHIHRCEGVTGAGGQARLLVQQVRSLPVHVKTLGRALSHIQIRSIKLGWVEQVGLGWSLEETREIARQEVGPTEVKGALPAYYTPRLSGIRVLDSVRDLGGMQLSTTP